MWLWSMIKRENRTATITRFLVIRIRWLQKYVSQWLLGLSRGKNVLNNSWRRFNFWTDWSQIQTYRGLIPGWLLEVWPWHRFLKIGKGVHWSLVWLDSGRWNFLGKLLIALAPHVGSWRTGSTEEVCGRIFLGKNVRAGFGLCIRSAENVSFGIGLHGKE